jgi:hypothetical protein
MLLLEKLSRLSAKHIIIDTNTSRIKKPVILLRKEQGGKMRLVGHPSKAGVEAMLANYGWQTREFDWKQSGLLSGITYRQYQSGRRITVIGSR